VYSPTHSVPPPSHLTSYTVNREPALYRHITFHNPNLISIFCRLGRLSKECVQVRGSIATFGEGLLSSHPTPSWRTTPCPLSAAAYSIYLKLPSTAGGPSSIRNLRRRHVATGTHLTWPAPGYKTKCPLNFKNLHLLHIYIVLPATPYP
jgi:hypothetical protein